MANDHRQIFVEESKEQITELNNSLLSLESDPDDAEAMDAIFRTAHTLKGNSAAMGFENASTLAHALEDLLDEVRQGRIGVTPELMDLLFDGIDELEAMLADIAEDGETNIDPEVTGGKIRALVAAETGDASASSVETTTTSSPTVTAELDEATASGDSEQAVEHDRLADLLTSPGLEGPLSTLVASAEARIVHARVDVGETEMKGVDGLFIMQAVEGAFGDPATVPPVDAIEDGEYDDGFDLFVDAESADVVEAGLDAVSQVDTVTATDVSAAVGLDVDSQADSTATDAAESADSAPESTDDSSAASTTDAPTSTPERSKMDDNISSVRVDVDQLDTLYGLVEQLVTSRIKLRREMDEAGIKKSENLDELDKISSNLQNTVMDMRLVPLKQVVDTFPRLVRDIARDQEKQVHFVIEGEDIELDRTILTEIRDPLMHILRNSVDHGIESPEAREAAGKSPEGTVELTATRERDHVTIQVSDDGGGLDVDSLRAKALEKGVKTAGELDAMSDSEVYDLIFHPGFSTTEEITDISGRGVGMDVVNSTVKQLDGTVSVDSDPGEGTTVSLRLPVTVAIVKMMFVRVGDTEYGIPVKNIDEVARMRDVRTVKGSEVIEHDDDIYPVVRLGQVLDEPTSSTNGDGMLLRIRQDKRQVALHCDAVLDQEEVVVKPLEGVLSGIPGLSGTAVLGDGDVVTILDVVTL
ncbi:chemotaxis protein CheA [Halogranum rubrum]|uniref:Chemotaxis protein CheA n=1 Tax=Halogranum salarium B-1 TaxID=1210908 RepID=J3EYB8_9EURY|nr:chemotaxis protein CheA [Halogranum salarium]EJN60302.1 hypothetical protein HSB1_09050 [Halogranum salarium B-1]